MNTKEIFIKAKKSKDRPDLFLVYVIRIFLIVLVGINLYPILFTFFTSLKTTEDFYGNIWSLPDRLFLNNYIDAFITGYIGEYFINSLAILVITIISVTLFGTLAAYAVARLKIPFVEIVVAVLIIIQILPTESMIMPLYILMSKLKLIGIIYLPISLAYTGWLLPGTIVILKNFILTIPSELLESARMDGSNELHTMYGIVLPLTGGAIATCTVLNFCFIWGELMWAQIATLTVKSGIPLTVGLINFQGQYTTNWGLLTAAICMILIPLYIMFLFMQKYFVQGLTAGAVKG